MGVVVCVLVEMICTWRSLCVRKFSNGEGESLHKKLQQNTIRWSILWKTAFAVMIISYLLISEWVTTPRDAVFSVLSRYFQSYFSLPLTELFISGEISGKLIIGLVAFLISFGVVFLIPRIVRRVQSRFYEVKIYTRKNIRKNMVWFYWSAFSY